MMHERMLCNERLRPSTKGLLEHSAGWRVYECCTTMCTHWMSSNILTFEVSYDSAYLENHSLRNREAEAYHRMALSERLSH